MSRRMPLVTLGMLIASAGLAPVAVNAANTPSNSSKDKTISYRWTDEQGVVHYGDRIPPQYAQKEQALLNSQGVVVRRLDAQKSAEQAAADARVHESVV